MLNCNNKKIIKKIKDTFGNSTDIVTKELTISNTKVSLVFFESTASDDKISNFIGKSLSYDIKNKTTTIFTNIFKNLQNTIPNSKLKIVKDYKDVFYFLSSGFTLIFVDGETKAIGIETKNILDRSITQPTNEPTLKGPKDSFTENFIVNIGLIRKRIKDQNLWFQDTVLGKRSKTKVSLVYINGLASKKNIAMIQKKLKNIKIDGILDSSYIRELLNGKQSSIFPRVLYTERPDLVANSLLNGKIAILVENSPFVLIIPGTLPDYFTSPEDFYIKPISASFNRILRYIAFLTAMLVPAIYIAISTFDLQIVPNTLLISFSIQKDSVPFPTLIEVLILIISFEILREADVRKPQFIGASISIVGALILGEAAVSAGIISPIVVIVISISAVAGMAFSDSDVIDAIRIWRLIFMLGASIFGTIGILFVLTIFITQLSSLNVMGYSYLSPIAPMNFYDLFRSIFRLDQKLMKDRTHFLNKNLKRMKINEDINNDN